MTTKLWFIYLALFALATFIDQIGGSAVSVGDPNDINSTVAFQLDEVSSGSGFLGLMRGAIDFFLTVVPKLILWNFGFLTGSLQIVQYTMVFVFGGLLTITLAGGAAGLIRRNV